MFKKGDICPICGRGKVSEKIITKKFKYKRRSISISDYHVFECDSCTEKIVSNKTLKETEKTLTDFRRKVDGLLTSDEIRAIREKLGKTQTEMANLIEVGEKNFARYENGQVTQSKTMDWLLRILDDDPNIFQKIEKKAFVTMKLDGCFVVRDMKIIQGNTSYFVAMPAKKLKEEMNYEVIKEPSGKGYGQKVTKFEYGDEDGEAAYAA